MITVSDIQQLIASWEERLDTSFQPSSYKDALSECIYELNQLITSSIDEELSYQEYLDSWAADDYLSTMEAHEQIA